MKRILITGANGFVGKNLKFRAKENGLEILEFNKGDKLAELEKDLGKIDFVFHLAGVNRSKEAKEFYEGNSDLTEELLEALKRNKSVPVLFSSSIQADKDNDYGKSKLQAEEALKKYSRDTGAPVFIYRLPNLFGKWSRPNYNTFIATFCHNISRDLPITIDNKEAAVELAYIDDVVASFLGKLDQAGQEPSDPYCRINGTYKTTVGEVAKKLNSYKEMRNDLSVGDLAEGFDRALYATYLSFLDKNDLSYDLVSHVDERGAFAEFIKTRSAGQFSVSASGKGVIRGNHYHNTKNEKFLIVKGQARLKFKNIANGEYVEYEASDKDLKVIDIPPGWAHSIENIDDSEIILLLWANEVFDKDNPDTFYYEVK